MSTAAFTHKIAYLPEPRMDVVTGDWLDWLADLGYTGLYLEPDVGGPRRSGNSSQFRTLYRLISLYDLAWGTERHRLRTWIDRTCDLAHERDLKVYLALWEPRIPAEAWGKFPVEWRGRGSFDRPPWDITSWCFSEPEAVAAFRRMAVEALRAVPKIDGLKLGTSDNDAHLCKPDACPRCADVQPGEQVRRVMAELIGAVDDAGLHREDFDYVLYTWWWPENAVDAVTGLVEGRRVTVLGRSTQGLEQYWRGQPLGTVHDLALGIEGVGDRFRRELRVAKARGWDMADMTGFGHTIEYFWLPYTPAPNRVAERIQALRRHGASGWFDYDCGGIYPGINAEIIRELHHEPGADPMAAVRHVIDRLYPRDERKTALAAYEAAEEALGARPIGYQP